ncbi:MAG: hypothetical protein KKB51_15210 [Candidatus Riflebacteria bacterium]|nr:hypothetical protein [Candidatus Riflebacteria bacterium]
MRNIGKIFEQQRLRLVRNLDLLEDFFKRHEALFSWQRPRAGTVTFPGYLAGSALEFCNKLVTEAGVMLIPGTYSICQVNICVLATVAPVLPKY